MKRRIIAAAQDKPEIELLASNLKDDFDYILSGLDKLDRSGHIDAALTIGNEIKSQFQSYILEIADEIE